MKTQLYSLLTAIVFITAACSPEPVYRLKSENQPTYRHQGAEYLVSQIDDTEVVLAFYRHVPGMISFDVEVVNHSNADVEVDPSTMYYRLFTDAKVPNQKGILAASVPAFDPEEELLRTDLAVSRVNAEMKTAAVLDATVEVTSLAADIAAFANRDYHYLAASSNERVVRSIDRSVRYANYDRFTTDLNYRRASWEQDHIRVTDLASSEFIRGLVSFPVRQHQPILEVVVPVGDTEHTFRFLMLKFKP